MKRYFYIIILFGINFAFSQTKEETENWLIDKLNEHSHIEGGISDEVVCAIEDGNIIEESYIKTFNTTTIFGLPIKSITKITVFKNKNKYTFSLYCGTNCVNQKINKIVGKTEENTIKELDLEIDKNDSTLVERIPKALIHLVKLYGGNAKLVIHKEPF